MAATVSHFDSAEFKCIEVKRVIAKLYKARNMI